jgi:hypothetical protein
MLSYMLVVARTGSEIGKSKLSSLRVNFSSAITARFSYSLASDCGLLCLLLGITGTFCSIDGNSVLLFQYSRSSSENGHKYHCTEAKLCRLVAVDCLFSAFLNLAVVSARVLIVVCLHACCVSALRLESLLLGGLRRLC